MVIEYKKGGKMTLSIEFFDFFVISKEDVEIIIKDVVGWYLDKVVLMVLFS